MLFDLVRCFVQQNLFHKRCKNKYSKRVSNSLIYKYTRPLKTYSVNKDKYLILNYTLTRHLCTIGENRHNHYVLAINKAITFAYLDKPTSCPYSDTQPMSKRNEVM